jgi:formylglycine-generating enzyme required for sulfatase activity
VAKLVPVSGGYSIDATEVTRNQYAAWLATGPSRLGQDSYCAWNSSFTPRCEWPPGMKGAHPVVCVDWCDAYAYCRGVGKLLCGSRAGGPSGYDDYADATKSRWQDACSSGGAHMYPYGGGGAAGTIGYQATTCNGADNGKGTTLPVGTCPGCVSSESGYGGVYDLSGNVWEWEDSCGTQGGNAAYCRARGGSFQGSYGYLRCAYGYAVNRSGSYDSVGFRCCSR